MSLNNIIFSTDNLQNPGSVKWACSVRYFGQEYTIMLLSMLSQWFMVFGFCKISENDSSSAKALAALILGTGN
jgi:hypothetical protein